MEWIVMLIKALAATAGGLLALWGGYYLVSGLMCWRGQKPFPIRPARTKFAVLIAARNEELVIGPLINSLLMQDYPPGAIRHLGHPQQLHRPHRPGGCRVWGKGAEV